MFIIKRLFVLTRSQLVFELCRITSARRGVRVGIGFCSEVVSLLFA